MLQESPSVASVTTQSFHVSLRAAITEFIHDRRSLRRSQRTCEFYEGNLTRFADSLPLPDMPLDQAMTLSHIRRFFGTLDPAEISQDTFAAYDRVLRIFSKFCLAEGWLERDPMEGRPRLRQNRNAVPDTLNLEEITLIRETCDKTPAGIRDLAIILLMLDTGMRAGEICDLTNDRLTIYRNKGKIRIPAEGSKGANDRTVVFSGSTLVAMSDWLTIRKPARLDLVFVSVTGRKTLTDRPMTPSGLNQMMRRRAKRAGVQGRRWCHIWRHTFAKFYVLHGGDLESLRRLLGHSSLETVRIYLQFQTQELEQLQMRHSPVAQLDGLDIEPDRSNAVQDSFFSSQLSI